ncbi:MAG: hypothetical protein ABI720_07845, partial [Actinomycetes bacterium]
MTPTRTALAHSVIFRGGLMFPVPVLPPPLAEAVAVVHDLPVDHVAGAEERSAWLAGLRQIVDAAESAFTTVLADFDATGDGQVLHAASTTQSWLRGALGMASGEA